MTEESYFLRVHFYPTTSVIGGLLEAEAYLVTGDLPARDLQFSVEEGHSG